MDDEVGPPLLPEVPTVPSTPQAQLRMIAKAYRDAGREADFSLLASVADEWGELSGVWKRVVELVLEAPD